jgi:hypothetical protein
VEIKFLIISLLQITENDFFPLVFYIRHFAMRSQPLNGVLPVFGRHDEKILYREGARMRRK